MFKPTGTPQPQKRYKDAHGALVTVESVDILRARQTTDMLRRSQS
ncbi:DUF4222 domain-containing protein [Escherichia coli]|nr:DUF4222 domain-containing protein [Escherichia coli]EGZ3317640.1 DUF4222 domain-containing protein [Escherichia coli]EHK1283263.1 DUF4222 domain-containing protein [Escherichia coli]EHX0306923.1 DUF4222 domain-containing protein [Escherichia coli]EHX0308497.1 DUF4222 domain-containing protein [Escherichia coli]